MIEKLLQEIEDRLKDFIEGERLARLVRSSLMTVEEVLRNYSRLKGDARADMQQEAEQAAKVRDRLQTILARLQEPPPDAAKVLAILEAKDGSYDKASDVLRIWSEDN
jgi:hypothetical protein